MAKISNVGNFCQYMSKPCNSFWKMFDFFQFPSCPRMKYNIHISITINYNIYFLCFFCVTCAHAHAYSSLTKSRPLWLAQLSRLRDSAIWFLNIFFLKNPASDGNVKKNQNYLDDFLLWFWLIKNLYYKH